MSQFVIAKAIRITRLRTIQATGSKYVRDHSHIKSAGHGDFRPLPFLCQQF